MHSLLKKGFCLYVYSLLACYKNIKNGHLYRLFSSDICNSSPKKTYRKPTRSQVMAFYLSG